MDSDEDKSLALTTSPVFVRVGEDTTADDEGFDHAGKKKKLPFGPLPWPTGLPAPGYVPQLKSLCVRWASASGRDRSRMSRALMSVFSRS